MRYFTPELLARLNSTDDSVAAAAESQWDAALDQYNQQLTAELVTASSSIRDLAGLCLHDAELLLFHPGTMANGTTSSEMTSNSYHGIAALLLKTEDQERVSLLFELTAPPVLDRAAAKPTGEHLYWLYEELQRQTGNTDRFELRILLSDHSILTLAFSAVSIVRYEEGKHSPFGEVLRQSA
jgi:hypothetical protein